MKPTELKPRLTEKTYSQAGAKNQVYVFDVDSSENKHTVARSVEGQFKVGVVKVRLLNNKGKAKRTIAAKGRKVYAGREASVKKAYVTLKAGDSLPFFQSIEEEEAKQERTQKKMEQAMEKKDAKEAKSEAKSRPKSSTKIAGAKPAPEPAKRPHGFLRLGGRRGGNRGGNK